MIPGNARADHHPLQLVQPGTEAVDRQRCLKLNLDTLLAQPLCLLLKLLALAGVDHDNGMARGLQEAGSTLTRAPKSGFAVPLNSWLRGDLREFVDDSLKADPKSMAEFFEPNSVMSLYEDFLHGKNNCGELIWSLVVFRNWQRNYLER